MRSSFAAQFSQQLNQLKHSGISICRAETFGSADKFPTAF
jgi:hypothetical protein